tara:strand:+ start:252 stop:509 length:258 start_codon:yes stop_codon:yes gene_type:complete
LIEKPMQLSKVIRSKSLWFLLFLFSFALALCSVYIRINTTLLGYEIGKLKAKELSLIRKKSLLTMEYAKITSKENLLKRLKENKD